MFYKIILNAPSVTFFNQSNHCWLTNVKPVKCHGLLTVLQSSPGLCAFAIPIKDNSSFPGWTSQFGFVRISEMPQNFTRITAEDVKYYLLVELFLYYYYAIRYKAVTLVIDWLWECILILLHKTKSKVIPMVNWKEISQVGDPKKQNKPNV